MLLCALRSRIHLISSQHSSNSSIPSMASLGDRVTSPAEVPASETKVDWAEEISQLDGATEFNAGSAMTEPEYDVEVKLIDQNSPLYSIKSFEELGLLVFAGIFLLFILTIVQGQRRLSKGSIP